MGEQRQASCHHLNYSVTVVIEDISGSGSVVNLSEDRGAIKTMAPVPSRASFLNTLSLCPLGSLDGSIRLYVDSQWFDRVSR